MILLMKIEGVEKEEDESLDIEEIGDEDREEEVKAAMSERNPKIA